MNYFCNLSLVSFIMEAAHKTFNKSKQTNVASQNFETVLQLVITWNPELNNRDTIESLQGDISIELLCCGDMILGSSTLFRVLRDYLVLKECK